MNLNIYNMTKNIIFFLFSLILSCSAYAEQVVGRYQNSYFGKEFNIEASQENGKLEQVTLE